MRPLHAPDRSMTGVGHDRGGEPHFGFRQRRRIGGRGRNARHRIVGRIETIGVNLPQVGNRRHSARVEFAVGEPDRRVAVVGVIGIESRPIIIAADDAIELAIGEFAQ